MSWWARHDHVVAGVEHDEDVRIDRPLGAQHGVSQLKRCIRPQARAVIERTAKHGKIIQARRARLRNSSAAH